MLASHFPYRFVGVEEQAADPNSKPTEHTYQELATIVGEPTNARNINKALGLMGFALRDLMAADPKTFGKIPPIQLVVWSKGNWRPGDSALYFLDILIEQLKKLPEEARRAIALHVHHEVISYPHWRDVLKALIYNRKFFLFQLQKVL